MTAFVLTLGRGRTLSYVAIADDPDPNGARGWRDLVWTADRGRAEKFSSIRSAEQFARSRIPHQGWAVAVAPPTGRLGGDGPSGTPVQMAAAA